MLTLDRGSLWNVFRRHPCSIMWVAGVAFGSVLASILLAVL